MSTTRYLEDYQSGQQFSAGPVTVTTEMIKTFARDYDPQGFHTDEAAADNSFFKGLAASGWHTAALTMRMLVESDLSPEGGVIGGGVDELKWPVATRPGDTLRLQIKVEDVRRSTSKPERGFIRVRVLTLNQNDVVAQSMVANLVVPTRSRG